MSSHFSKSQAQTVPNIGLEHCGQLWELFYTLMIIFLKIISRELDNFIYLYIKKIHSIGKCVSKITLTIFIFCNWILRTNFSKGAIFTCFGVHQTKWYFLSTWMCDWLIFLFCIRWIFVRFWRKWLSGKQRPVSLSHTYPLETRSSATGSHVLVNSRKTCPFSTN